MKRLCFGLFVSAIVLLGNCSKTFAQDAYIGDIKLTAINFTQAGWLDCNGQILQVAQYQALYSVIGNAYGGNAPTTFALPDLRGRVPVNIGQGTGLSNYTLGQSGGVETVSLSTAQMPAHSHAVAINTGAGNSNVPTGSYPANTGNLDKEYSTSTNGTNTTMVQSNGNGTAHENRQPYLAIRYIICVSGLYPERP